MLEVQQFEELLETIRTETSYAFIFIVHDGKMTLRSNCDKLVHAQIAMKILERIIDDEVSSAEPNTLNLAEEIIN